MNDQKTKSICIARRPTDNDGFIAYSDDDKSIYGTGATSTLAVGDLIIAHPEYFNIEIRIR